MNTNNDMYQTSKFNWKTARKFSLLLVILTLGLSACSGSQGLTPARVSSAGLPNTGATTNSAATPGVGRSAAAKVMGTPGSQPATIPPVAASGLKAYIGLFKENAVAVFDTGSNRVLSKIPVPAGPHGLAITPDGRWVYASSDGDSKVSVIDTQTDQVVKTIEVGQAPHGLAITPDGKQVLAAVFGASQVVFIDTATNQVTGQVAVPSPHNIAISPNGRWAYVAAQKKGATALTILDLQAKAQTGSIPLVKTPRALNFSPDGKLLYFTQAGVDAVQVLDPASNQITAQIPVGASPHHPLFTPDGQAGLVVSQGPGQLEVLDPKTNIVLTTIAVGKMPHWIAVNPQGTTAWVTNEASNDLSVVDLETFSVTTTIPVGSAPRKIVVQPQKPVTAKSMPMGGTVITTSIEGMNFKDQVITIKAGQTITWTNHDSIAHTVTSDQGLWNSGDIPGGKDYSLTLTHPGQYGYHCSNHPFMTGTIVVTG